MTGRNRSRDSERTASRRPHARVSMSAHRRQSAEPAQCQGVFPFAVRGSADVNAAVLSCRLRLVESSRRVDRGHVQGNRALNDDEPATLGAQWTCVDAIHPALPAMVRELTRRSSRRTYTPCQGNYLILPGGPRMRRLRKTLQSLLAARHEAVKLEDRFFKQMGRLASTMMNGAKVPARTAKRRTVPRRNLKCPRCSRRFARPLHLGRHLSATHGRRRKTAA